MKKLVLVTALVLLVLGSGFAEGNTWTNPDDLLFGTYFEVPRSMVSAVTNGVCTDEIDQIILAPANLSNYEGFTIYTGYGNYEYDYWGTGTNYVSDFMNPFADTDGTFVTEGVDDGTNLGDFTLGVTGELLGFRGGVITGFEFEVDDNMNIGGSVSQYSNDESTVIDSDDDGTADYTFTNVEDYTDTDCYSDFRFGAGTDLGFLGASMYLMFDVNNRTVGGSYVYTRGTSEDTDNADPNDIITSKTVYYGYKDEGKTGLEPDDSYTNWLFGVRGHLPLELFDISMPVRADVVVGGDNSVFAGGLLKTTETITATNVTGVTDTAATSSITAVYGTNDGDPWNASDLAGVITNSTTDYTQAEFQTMASNVATGTGYSDALDPEEFSESNFMAGFEGLIDPEIVVNDIFSVRTRGQLGYMMSFTSVNDATIRSVSYTQAEDGADSSTYSYEETTVTPQTVGVNIIDLELGGIMDLHNENDTLGVTAGLFYHPNFEFTSTKADNTVTTVTESWIDGTDTDLDAAAWGDTVGIGSFQGTYTSTDTTTYDSGKMTSESVYENVFYIPVTTRVKLAKGALELFGGYTLAHSKTTTVTKDYTSFAENDVVETLADSDGNAIEDTTTDDSVADGPEGVVVTESVTDNNEWEGQMSWMLRWNAMEGMTVDFYGESLMEALDFELLGGGGFNPADFINAVGISVTISAK